MTTPDNTSEPRIRPATRNDIPILASHRRKMFEEMGEKSGISADPSVFSALETIYAGKLGEWLESGACVAWVIESGSRGVSSGAISIMAYGPVPHDLCPDIAFLHSVYTEKEFRNRHFAQWITDEAARYCSTHGIRRLYLFASDAGRLVYEKAGFTPVQNLMMLFQE